jgi:hypothetical protein
VLANRVSPTRDESGESRGELISFAGFYLSTGEQCQARGYLANGKFMFYRMIVRFDEGRQILPFGKDGWRLSSTRFCP